MHYVSNMPFHLLPSILIGTQCVWMAMQRYTSASILHSVSMVLFNEDFLFPVTINFIIWKQRCYLHSRIQNYSKSFGFYRWSDWPHIQPQNWRALRDVILLGLSTLTSLAKLLSSSLCLNNLKKACERRLFTCGTHPQLSHRRTLWQYQTHCLYLWWILESKPLQNLTLGNPTHPSWRQEVCFQLL